MLFILSLWNCKCDWIQTSEPVTAGNPPSSTQVSMPGLRGNPGITGQVFSNDAPYYRQAGENALTRKAIEKQCELINTKSITHEVKQQLKDKISQCIINEQTYSIEFHSRGIEHCLGGLFGEQDYFWIKNTILSNIDKYLKSAVCVGKKLSDSNHNTNAKTKRLKEHTHFFYYFLITLPNGKAVYLHLGKYKKEYAHKCEMYLYSITSNMPKNIQSV